MHKLLIILISASLSFSAYSKSFEKKKSDEKDVSTLNNQLVKVGDQNQYLHQYFVWNISSNPIGWILGSYGLAVSHAFHPNFAITFDINYVDGYMVSDIDTTGIYAGVSVPIYFRAMHREWYLEPGFTYQNLNADDTKVSVFGPLVYAGYHWLWDSGLNISLAFGIGRNWSNKEKVLNEDGDEVDEFNKVFPAGYLRFGYAFD